ncbi:MAG: hypothetical protein LBE09_07520 [Christensenellaceae bacterium]|jgi:hypothetical protein|nr:hypothetical protein [Christensenellaceae bacterium]
MSLLINSKPKRNIILLSVILVIGVLITLAVINGLSAHAKTSSGYRRKDMQKSYSYTQYNSNIWTKSNFWDVEVHYDGTARTAWLGAVPFNADSIVHRDILTCSGIDSMSVGVSGSGPNASVSVSGHSATYTYSIQNYWNISTDYNYYTRGLLAVWNLGQRAEASVQLGYSFYTFST